MGDGTGERFPGLDVLGVLGHGAAATVLRARRTVDGVTYALKILDAAVADPDQVLVTFRREAALLASVDHPELIRIHEVGEVEGRPYLVMDLVDGESLAEVVARGPLPPLRVVALVLDLLEPLAAVHRSGLVHRDLKPSNIMVRPDGRAQLIDFGLAGRETTGEAEAVVGTLAYAPPEQSGTLGRPVDHRSDLYSLGIVLFECLTGQPPFAAADLGELLRMHAVTVPPDLREVVPGLPGGLADVVSTLLAKDPDDRYQCVEAVMADLRRLMQQPDGPVDRSRTLTPDRPTAHGPLIGRADVVDRLMARWEQARGGVGGVCVVRGADGMGKSRLAAEIGRRATSGGGVVLEAGARPDDPVPLGPLGQAVTDHLRTISSLPDRERAEAHDRIRRSAQGVGPWLVSVCAALADVIGPTPPIVDDRQDRFVLAVVAFLTSLATECGGLLLVLDDVQWLDHGTDRVLRRIADELDDVPLLVLATVRAGETMSAGPDVVDTVPLPTTDLDLALDPLDPGETSALVCATIPGTRSDDALPRLLLARGNGNPLVTQEYLRAIVDAGLLHPRWGRWTVDEAGLDALQLPRDALGLLCIRLQRLEPASRDLLVTAAVDGASFRPEVIAAAHSVPLVEVLDTLAEGARQGLVEARREGGFAFVHNGVRDALRSDLDDAALAGRHLALAEALESLPTPSGGTAPERAYSLARHYLAAGADGALPPVRAACLAAGELALLQHAPAEAVRFFGHVVADSPTSSQSVDPNVLLSLGKALKQTGRFTEAVGRFRQALAGESDPFRRAEILFLEADAHRATWSMADGFAAVSDGLAELGTRLPRSRLLLALTTVGMLLAVLVARPGGRRSGALTPSARRRHELIADNHWLGGYHAVLQQRPGLVAAHALRSVYWSSRVGEGQQYVQAQCAFGIMLSALGLRRASARAFDRAQADAVLAMPNQRALVSYQRELAEYMAGKGSGDGLSRVLEQSGQWLDPASYAEAVSALIAAALAQGRNQEARRWWTAAERRLALGVGERTALWCTPAMLAAADGRHAEAARLLRRTQEEHAGPLAPGLVAFRAAAEIFVLVEQNELGAPFDRAVTACETNCLPPALVPRHFRGTHFQLAMGRIAQAREAGPSERAACVARARGALARLRKSARDDVARSWLSIARADLLVVTGRPRRALRILNADQAIHRPPAPAVSFERARVRARALQALGDVEEARLQAQTALGIAQEQDWAGRVGRVAAEFRGLRLRLGGGTSVAVASGPRSLGRSSPGQTLTSVAHSQDRRRLRALERIGVAAARVLDPDELARIALDETISTLNAERAFLFLLGDDDRLVPRLGRDAQGTDFAAPAGHSASLVERVRLTREPLVITGTEEGAALGAESVVAHGLRSVMVAPLMLDDRLLGVVYLDSQVAKGIFTADDVGILIALTNSIAASLETTRAAQLEISVRTAQRERDLADRLREAFEAMSSTLDPAIVLDRLLHWTAVLLPNDGIWLLAPQGAEYTVTGPGAEEPAERFPADGDRAVASLFALDRPRTGADLPVPATLARRVRGATSWAVLPLRSRSADHGVLGVLVVASAEPGADLGQQLDVGCALVAHGLTAHDNASLFAQVRTLAVMDGLTGIANRRSFFEIAGRALGEVHRRGQPAVGLMLDIDHFKAVNDTFGHSVGDQVIKTVAARLSLSARARDVLGRYGGEEFALVATGLDLACGLEVGERLRAVVATEPVETSAGPLLVTVSVGVAAAAADDDLAVLLARADQALYEAKHAGRDRVRGVPADRSSVSPA